MINNILTEILDKEDLFVPLIFTKKQFEVIKKRHQNKRLLNAEKKALYTSIKKKFNALNFLNKNISDKEYFIIGTNKIISERLIEAKDIIQEYCKDYDKVFVSGSFLFKEKYEDIDIFIIMKRGYKEKWDGKRHVIFLTEKRLSQPIFQSASKISISNFVIPGIMKKPKLKLLEVMSTYHEAIIELLRKEEKPEMARRLIFEYELLCNNNLLDPKELYEKTQNITIKEINKIIKVLLRRLFSKTYLYVKIHNYIKTLAESSKNIHPNIHLNLFKKTYEELIYGRSRSKEAVN